MGGRMVLNNLEPKWQSCLRCWQILISLAPPISLAHPVIVLALVTCTLGGIVLAVASAFLCECIRAFAACTVEQIHLFHDLTKVDVIWKHPLVIAEMCAEIAIVIKTTIHIVPRGHRRPTNGMKIMPSAPYVNAV